MWRLTSRERFSLSVWNFSSISVASPSVPTQMLWALGEEPKRRALSRNNFLSFCFAPNGSLMRLSMLTDGFSRSFLERSRFLNAFFNSLSSTEPRGSPEVVERDKMEPDRELATDKDASDSFKVSPEKTLSRKLVTASSPVRTSSLLLLIGNELKEEKEVPRVFKVGLPMYDLTSRLAVESFSMSVHTDWTDAELELFLLLKI